LNDFHFWTLEYHLGRKPGLGVRVSVHEEYAGGLNFFASPAEDIFAGGVGGEVEVTNFASNGQSSAFPPIDLSPLACFAEKSGGGCGIGVPNKKDRIVFARKK
jgi:hypothetical protein